jgi:hypothetical protein
MIEQEPESITADLTVPERILLLCIDSRTDWQKVSRITGETVTAVVAKGLVDRDLRGGSRSRAKDAPRSRRCSRKAVSRSSGKQDHAYG